MSRNRDFTVRKMIGLSPWEKNPATVFGDNRNKKSVDFLKHWLGLGVLDYSKLKRLGLKCTSRQIVSRRKQWREEYLCRIETELNDAIKTGDGSFFRGLAGAIERKQFPVDRLRERLMSFASIISLVPGHRVTLKIVHQIVEQNGHEIGKDQLRRLSKECGIELLKGKGGRPNNSDNSRP